MPNSSLAVLGAGSWGTALAICFAKKYKQVYLWGHHAEHIANMQATHCNTRYLPDISLPKNLQPTDDLKLALTKAEDWLIVVPSHAFRATLQLTQNYLTRNKKIIWATKGLDPTTHDLLHLTANELLGDRPVAMLSGPSFAKEVAQGLPTATTLASTHEEFAIYIGEKFHSKTFRVYRSQDLVGVEVGGAMKNVLAIGVGIADGLGFGANARSALITRGLAEMTRLGMAMGGQLATFMGLAGMGDLVLTCTDNQSRNRRLGLALGEGQKISEALKVINQTVEGIETARQIHHLAKRMHVEVPISEQIYQVLHQQLDPREAVKNLLERAPKAEGF